MASGSIIAGDTVIAQIVDAGISGGASLPAQGGNSGKFLTTNGTAASWGTPVAGLVGSVSLANQVSGNLPVGNLATGSAASAATYWRGDGSWKMAPTIVAMITTSSQQANVASAILYTATSGGFFRVSCYSQISAAAAASSTMPTAQLLWFKGDTNSPVSIKNIAATSTANTPATITTGQHYFNVFPGSNIYYSTASYATAGTTSLTYESSWVLEQLG